jgi:hypothetical protein
MLPLSLIAEDDMPLSLRTVASMAAPKIRENCLASALIVGITLETEAVAERLSIIWARLNSVPVFI